MSSGFPISHPYLFLGEVKEWWNELMLPTVQVCHAMFHMNRTSQGKRLSQYFLDQ